MKKLSQVVMLPTEKATHLFIFANKPIFDSKTKVTDKRGQHLYILSDDKLKVEDLPCYVIYNDTVQLLSILSVINEANKDGCKKIISTTDESLVIINESYGENVWTSPYPRPSNEFLKKFCELGGIDLVLVDYYDDECQLTICDDRCSYPACSKPGEPKIAPDNTITIYPIDSLKKRIALLSAE